MVQSLRNFKPAVQFNLSIGLSEWQPKQLLKQELIVVAGCSFAFQNDSSFTFIAMQAHLN